MVVTLAGGVDPKLIHLWYFASKLGQLISIRRLLGQMKMLVILVYLCDDERSESGEVGVSLITLFVSS